MMGTFNKNSINFQSDAVLNANKSMWTQTEGVFSANCPDFNITNRIRFHQQLWDFSECNVNNIAHRFFILNFSKVDLKFVVFIKQILLYRLMVEKVHVKTAHACLANLSRFARFLIGKGVTYCWQIDVQLIQEFFNTIHAKKERTYFAFRKDIEKLLLEISSLHGNDYSNVVQYLRNTNYANIKKLKAESQAGLTNMIPFNVFSKIVSLAIQEIKDESLTYRDRMSASLIVILAETGMRVEELTLLERNKLKEIKLSDDRKASYLEFKVFKNKMRYEGGFVKSVCYASETCAFAYGALEKLAYRAINDLSTIRYKKRLLGVRGIKFPWATKTSEIEDALSKFTQIDIQQMNEECHRYLYVNLLNGQSGFKDATFMFRQSLKKFFFRNRDILNLDKLDQKDLSKLKNKILLNNENDKFILRAEKQNLEKFIGTKLYYASPHQFRVTVCTKLFHEGVPLDYIRTHMNHLTEDATIHYGRFSDMRSSIDEGLKILSKMANGDGLIELDPNKVSDIGIKEELTNAKDKADYIAINKFLKNNKLNIATDLQTVIKMLRQNDSLLLETELGFCAWNSIHAICERREYFSSLSDFYHIGVKVPSLRTLHLSYERFKEKETVVMYNKEIVERNPKLKLEYGREKRALQIYIEKTLLPELRLAKEELNLLGRNDFVDKYPNLQQISLRIDVIVEEEIVRWTA